MEEVGVWTNFLIITTTFEVVKNGLLKNPLIKFVHDHDRSMEGSIQAASLTLNGLISVLLASLVFGFSAPIEIFLNAPGLNDLLKLFFINALLLIPFSHVEYLLQSAFRFDKLLKMYLIRQGIFFVGILTGVLFPALDLLSLKNLVYFQGAGILLGLMMGAGAARISFSAKALFSWMGQLWRYGRFTMATNVSSIIFRSSDQLMTSMFISVEAAALYNAAIRISNLVDLPSTSIAEALFPKSVQETKKGDYSGPRALYEKAVAAILLIVVPMSLFIFIFPKLILQIIAGSSYTTAAAILQITIAYGLFLPFMKQNGMVLDSIGKPRVNFLVNVFLTFFNITINYYLIHKIGLLGAAYGSLATYFIGFILSQIILARLIGLNTLKVFTTMPQLLQSIKAKAFGKVKAVQ